MICAFTLPQRQSRYLELLANPRRRHDLTRELSHFKHLDPNYALTLPPGRKRAIDICELLRSKGAPETCYAISEEDDLDGKELALRDALDTIVWRGIGTFHAVQAISAILKMRTVASFWKGRNSSAAQ